MLLTLFRTKFKCTIYYKSGQQHSFWCYDFVKRGDTWTWTAVSQSNKPVVLGIDDIESVWQTGWHLNWVTAIVQIFKNV